MEAALFSAQVHPAAPRPATGRPAPRACYGVLALAAVVAACAPPAGGQRSQTGEELAPPAIADYRPPLGGGLERTATVANDQTQVWTQVIESLNGLEYQISFLDLRAGILVYTFSGSGEGLVDCGTLAAVAPGTPPQDVSAVAPRLTYARDIAGQSAIIDRGIALDTRSVVQMTTARGGQTSVGVDTTYVVTRDLRVRRTGGQLIGERQDFAVFTSDGEAPLQSVVCRPTGAVEQVVLANLTDAPATTTAPADRGAIRAPTALQRPADEAAAGLPRLLSGFSCAQLEAQQASPGGYRVTGFVETTQDRQLLRASLAAALPNADLDIAVDVLPWPHCEVLSTTSALEDANKLIGGGLSVGLGNGASSLVDGDTLFVEAKAPAFDNFSYLFYVERNGLVFRLMPSSLNAANRRFADEAMLIDNRHRVTSPFGAEMLVMIASSVPLALQNELPDVVEVSEFVPVLQESLAAAKAQDANVVATHFVVHTQPRS